MEKENTTCQVFAVYKNGKEQGRFKLYRNVDNELDFKAVILKGSQFYTGKITWGPSEKKIENEKIRWSFLDCIDNNYKFKCDVEVSGRDLAMHLIRGSWKVTDTLTQDGTMNIKQGSILNMSNREKV